MGHWYSPALFTYRAKHCINCSVWKEKQSITPGLRERERGLASIVRAAAKHHSPIICDSSQCRVGLCHLPPPPRCHCKHKVGLTPFRVCPRTEKTLSVWISNRELRSALESPSKNNNNNNHVFTYI